MLRVESVKKTIDFRKRIGRFSSLLPILGLVSHPDRPQGISAMMRVKDEAEWIQLSILSLRGFADEFVVVDNGSTDGTLEIVREVKRRNNLNLKLISFPEEDFWQVSTLALANTSFQWVLRWDGDMVGHTSGPANIVHLRERLMDLDQRVYYQIYFPHIQLDGDLFHQIATSLLHSEDYLFTFSPKLGLQRLGRFEELLPPIYYKKIYLKQTYSFHIRSVKPVHRLLFRGLWTDWRELNDRERFPSLVDYVRFRILKDWGVETFEEAYPYILEEICEHLVPYNSMRFGKYPDLLREKLSKPIYRMIYKEGEIVGRQELGGVVYLPGKKG
jgi:glycosyltransferase involved in cell wall biosynthesis